MKPAFMSNLDQSTCYSMPKISKWRIFKLKSILGLIVIIYLQAASSYHRRLYINLDWLRLLIQNIKKYIDKLKKPFTL